MPRLFFDEPLSEESCEALADIFPGSLHIHGRRRRLHRLECSEANNASIASRRGTIVAQLMVRNVDEAVVRALKKRAASRNHSAEQEHREILEQALLRPKRRTLAEVLAAMPDAGQDVDFARRQTDRRT